MTAIEVCKLAFSVREAQKRYFRERTRSALQESKRLERDIDKHLDKMFGDNAPETPSLFPKD